MVSKPSIMSMLSTKSILSIQVFTVNMSSLKGLGVYGVSVGYKYVVPSGTG